jgi:hypothetical protein
LFRGAPVIIDLSEAASVEAVDGAAFTERVREQGLMPIGIQGVNADVAQKFGLAIMAGGRGSKPIEPEVPAEVPAPAPAPAPAAAAQAKSPR